MENTVQTRLFGGGQSSLSSITGIGAGTKPFSAAEKRRITRGFTLAEVLITLGIIGVVAAMTLPSLIQKNNNKVVETRLKKFYSSINQAILMAENDYGDKKIWYEDLAGADIDDEGNVIPDSSDVEKWFNKYLKPYMKVQKTETLADGSYMIYLSDGSAFRPWASSNRDWYFYPGNPKKCLDKYKLNIHAANGKCAFTFIFNPGSNSNSWKYHYNKGMEPYKVSWDGDSKKLYEGAKYSCGGNEPHYCTALIQMNGWKIPDDYPYKVSY